MGDDLDRLKAIAMAATPGPWRWGRESEPRNDVAESMFKLYSDAQPDDLRIMPVLCMVPETAWVTLGDDTGFIAAWSPSTALDVLQRLEAMTKARDEACALLEGTFEEISRMTRSLDAGAMRRALVSDDDWRAVMASHDEALAVATTKIAELRAVGSVP